MGREFYLYKRNGVYHAEILNPETGVRICYRSTETKNRDQALVTVLRWLKDGVPKKKRGRQPYKRQSGQKINNAACLNEILKNIETLENLDEEGAMQITGILSKKGLINVPVSNAKHGNIIFIDFLLKFWDYEKSDYIKDKLTHGHRFTRNHAYNCVRKVKNELAPHFQNKMLCAITDNDIETLANKLADRGLAASTINHVILTCATPLKWAFNKKLIPANPAAGLTKFAVKNKERGILTEAEAAFLFSTEWNDKRAYAASLLAATTGMRQGEILALRKSDIGEDAITVSHSYSPMDGLKCPKNGHNRPVPLLPQVKKLLMELLGENPHKTKDQFIFYGQKPDQPTDAHYMLDWLKEAMEKMGIDYEKRNITFHGWRHYFCSKITEIIDREKAAKVSGHLSEGVFKKYAGHIEEKNIREVGKAAAMAFNNVLQHRKIV